MNICKKSITIVSWNIAAINNNPFEYWLTYKENPKYEKLMKDVETFIENPGDNDVKVSKVFSEELFAQLDRRLTDVGWKSVRNYWDDDFKNRHIVGEFLKDPLLGSKRLASMPDRVTNTINTEDEAEPVVFRPTVINMYGGDLSTIDKWWKEWDQYMFEKPLKIKNSKKNNVIEEKKVYELLIPIKKAKYPKISEQEETDSLPLQTLCGAIFDAIMVYMMNTISTPEVWQPIKQQIVQSLNLQKIPNTLNILATQYAESADIVTLQEVSSAFIEKAKATPELDSRFHIVAPEKTDPVRDQNSVIFLSRTMFPEGSSGEITDDVERSFPAGAKVPVTSGDVLAITAHGVVDEEQKKKPFVIASFHGDTNGLATIPVLDAIVKTMKTNPGLVGHELVFGLDANTYENPKKPGQMQDVVEFGEHFENYGLTSCWGDAPQPQNYTTYNARTYLQPQLNKAIRQSEKRSKGDVNPKDFILFPKADYQVVKTWKDNTGEKRYIEDMAFPTLQFPSDHGIIATVIEPTVGK